MLLLYNTGNTAYHQITRDIMIHKKINVLLFKQYFLQWKAERKKKWCEAALFSPKWNLPCSMPLCPSVTCFPCHSLKSQKCHKKVKRRGHVLTTESSCYSAEGKVRGRGVSSVALHGNGCPSGAVMTFDLMDHQEGDEQAQQLDR